jgi:predicted phage terminase large subunit-like protein
VATVKKLRAQDLARVLDEADAEAARRSFREFFLQAFSLIEPADPYVHNWHVDAVCEHLEAVARGQIQRLAINIPPGTLKSSIVSIAWPAWMWTWRPAWRGIFSSYSQDLAVQFAVASRRLMDTEWYQRSFVREQGASGGALWKFSDDMNRKDMYTNTETGLRMSLSVGSKATGFRGNAVVADDPLNAKEAPSKLARDEVLYWWDKVMSSRVNNPHEDAFVIMMQRLHQDDPTGHVLRQGGYECLCLPAEFNPKKRCVVVQADGTTWRDPRTEPGELLFPARLSTEYLAKQKTILGSEAYSGQYNQDPTPPEGGMFKYAWWRFWRHDGSTVGRVAGVEVELDPVRFPRPEECHQGPAKVIPPIRHLIGSLDAAFKGDATSDYVVFGVWGIVGAERYLLDVVRGKLDYVATKREFLRLRAKWAACRKWLVEDKANGSAIIAELQGEVVGLVPINPEGGKEARAFAMSPAVEAGQLLVPDGATFTEISHDGTRTTVGANSLIEEHAMFPRGKNDDQVDMTSQVMTHLATSHDAARAALLFEA